jgi:hypothetical protein
MDGPVRPDVPPEDPQRPRVFSPEPVSTDHPHVLRWVALGALILVAVIAKPWAVGGAPEAGDGSSRPGAAVGEAAPSVPAIPPSASPAPPDRTDTAGPVVAGFCLDPGVWLVATVEGFGDRSRRIWRAMVTVSVADGPADPAIPTASIATEGVRTLGWCAPVVGRDRPGASSDIEAWSVEGVGARSMDLDRLRVSGPASPFGALYAPPADDSAASPPSASAATSWPDGRIVFRYQAGAMVRWFAIELDRHPVRLDGV